MTEHPQRHRIDVEKMQAMIRERELRDSLVAEFEATLRDRISRFMEINHHWVIPNTHFASVSRECIVLFRDGYYFGCISLVQAVSEAMVRFLCEQNGIRRAKSFETNLMRLKDTKNAPVFSGKTYDAFIGIWEGRDDYHHLNPGIPTENADLERIARKKLLLLMEVEKDVFGVEVKEGILHLNHPNNWDVDGDKANVYLMIEP